MIAECRMDTQSDYAPGWKAALQIVRYTREQGAVRESSEMVQGCKEGHGKDRKIRFRADREWPFQLDALKKTTAALILAVPAGSAVLPDCESRAIRNRPTKRKGRVVWLPARFSFSFRIG